MRCPPVRRCKRSEAASIPGTGSINRQYVLNSSADRGCLSARSNCGERLVCAAGLKTTAKALKATGIDAVVHTSIAH